MDSNDNIQRQTISDRLRRPRSSATRASILQAPSGPSEAVGLDPSARLYIHMSLEGTCTYELRQVPSSAASTPAYTRKGVTTDPRQAACLLPASS
jgi:hypothetical protein